MTRPTRGDGSRWNCSRGDVRSVGDDTIIGHGRRRKQATTTSHDWIWVRRGICHPCSKTFTILPDWLAPSGHFSLRCRQQACEQHRRRRFR